MGRVSDRASALGIAVAPEDAGSWIRSAVEEAGAQVVPLDSAEALIWGGRGPQGLQAALDAGPGISWVQLPSAGVERYVDLIDERRTWTCAKGIYAGAVAEHALALALAGVHSLPKLARAHAWKRTVCRELFGGKVTIVGGGGIARSLLSLLQPFRVEATVVRRHVDDVPGARRVVGPDALVQALTDADVVVLAAALTPETEGMIGTPELRHMKEDAWLVNVGRGKLVKTDDLVAALRDGEIGGAALDVTDPEPLPDGHPLWDLDNCLITPHCANPPNAERGHYAELVRENVRRRMEGEPLEGVIDSKLGY